METGTLLIIGKNWPEPSATAAGWRMVQLISCFREAGYSVVFASASRPTAMSANMNDLLDETRQVSPNDKGFDVYIRSLRPDVVLFDRFMIEEQFGWRVAAELPSAVRLLDTEDLHSLRVTRGEALSLGRPFTVRDWLGHESCIRELASIFRSDLSLIISAFEMQLLLDHAMLNKRLLHHIPFMFHPVLTKNLKPFEARSGFVFIGNGRHAPNTDAILWLKEAIWPLIRKDLPTARIDVCGAYLPQNILELHDPEGGFHIKGWVDSAADELKNKRVQLAPLRYGAGLKGKLALSMANGTPSVTTAVGAEGMHADMPWAGCMADDACGIAREAVHLYRDTGAWNQACANGQKIINTLYARDFHASALIERVRGLRSDLDSHRAGNVVGAILQRDSQASTRYMSRWIEAKNALGKAACNKMRDQ